MEDSDHAWSLLKTALVISGLIILFFSGVFPVEELLSLAPRESQTASVVPSEVATLTNKNRTEQGLAPLSINPLLTQAAQMKAEDMANNSYYAHVGPDGKTPLYWLDAVGYKYLNAGENLVIDRDASRAAVDAWMNSADHRQNILRPQFTEIGIGVAAGHYKGLDTIYVVQEFGTPYPSKAVRPAVVAQTPKPALATVPLAKPQIVTDVRTLADPIIGKEIAVAPLKTPAKPVVPVPATVSTTTTATSTFTFTLAPEFFEPVTIEDDGNASSTEAPLAANRLNWTVYLGAYIDQLKATLSRLLP